MDVMELKKCPFCGGEADYHCNYGRKGWFVYIKCLVCGSQTRTTTLYNGDDEENWYKSNRAQSVAAMWKRRCNDA